MEPAAGSAHVGSVEVVVTVGAFAGLLMFTLAVPWQLPATLLTTVMVCGPAPTALNVGDVWGVPPSSE